MCRTVGVFQSGHSTLSQPHTHQNTPWLIQDLEKPTGLSHLACKLKCSNCWNPSNIQQEKAFPRRLRYITMCNTLTKCVHIYRWRTHTHTLQWVREVMFSSTHLAPPRPCSAVFCGKPLCWSRPFCCEASLSPALRRSDQKTTPKVTRDVQGRT